MATVVSSFPYQAQPEFKCSITSLVCVSAHIHRHAPHSYEQERQKIPLKGCLPR